MTAWATWHVWVDWNGDGVYDSDEASRLISIPHIERGRAGPLDDPMVGVCELELRNNDNRFDAWSSDSVMYPNVGVNRRIKITVEIGGTEYPVFVGRTATPRSTGFRASGAMGGVRKLALTSYDGWKVLQTRKVDVTLQQNITQQAAIAMLLNAVGWQEDTTVTEYFAQNTFTPSHTKWGVVDEFTFVGDVPTYTTGGTEGELWQELADLATPLVSGSNYRFAVTLANVTAGDIVISVYMGDYGETLIGTVTASNGTHFIDFTYNGESYPPWLYATGTSGTFEVVQMSVVSDTAVWVLNTSKLDSTTVLGGVYGDSVDLSTQEGDTIPYWWIFSDEPPSQNLLDLVRTHLGRSHVGRDGKFVWRTVADDNGTAANLTLTDAMLQEMNIVYRLDDVRNKIRVRAMPRSLASVGVIYTFNEQPLFAANESREIWAEYTNASGERVPALNVVTPASGTDWTANTAQDGSGANQTASFSVSMTEYGGSAKLTITNNGVSAYLTLLQLRGQAVDNLESTAIVEEDEDSQETYGVLDLDMDLRWQQQTNIAKDFADFALAAYKDPQAGLELRFENSVTALGYDLGAKIQDATTHGTGLEYRLERITHEVPDGYANQRIYTTWTLLPILPDDAWILDSTTLSQLSQTTKLGF